MRQIENRLKEKIIGQDEAVIKVVKVIRTARANLKDLGRPAAVFLFVGHRGIGKKTLARALAELLFGSPDKMLWLDMSEYTEAHHTARLVGPLDDYFRPGVYEGVLTEWLRRKPYTIVLIEDVEQAHPHVISVFQDLFRGRLTDYKGTIIDARKTIFIMTSNTVALEKEGTMNQKRILACLEKIFRPEFLNCIDEIVLFRPLEPDSVFKIASNLLDSLRRRLGERNISLDIEDKALQLICYEGYHPEHGVSLMGRVIDRLITTPLSEKVLTGEVSSGDKVLVTTRDGRVEITKVEES